MPNLAEYLNRYSSRAIDPQGWLNTGDQVEIRDAIYASGRLSDWVPGQHRPPAARRV